ncbi:MAG: hypothetical protein IIT48_04920 [Lachnospiraceae bacterium]|nr:hypothetical protein [Lachnospiraceae bacterium]
MIKVGIFDMFETLVTHYNCPLYFGEQIVADDSPYDILEFIKIYNQQ